jgi:hypothetical protein
MKKNLLYSTCKGSPLKKTLTIIFFLTVTACSADTWEHTYGVFGTEDNATTVIPTSDGGYIAAGYVTAWGAGGKDVYVVKTDSMGHMLWQNVIGGGADDIAYGIVQNSLGQYYVAGLTKSFGAGDTNVYLIKLTSSGDTMWTKTFGGAQADYARAIVLTATEDIVLAGTTSSFGAGSSDMYLLKVDPAGTLLWSKTYGRTGYETGFCLDNVHDGGFILGGITTSYTTNYGYAVRTNSTGDTMWTKAYNVGVISYYGITGVKERANQTEFIFCGTGEISTNSYYNSFHMKVDLTGTQVYFRYSQLLDDAAAGITNTSDGGYATIGWYGNFGWRAQLIKYDNAGIRQWYKDFQYISQNSYPGFSDASSVRQTADGGYIISGNSEGYSPTMNFLLIKANGQGVGQVYPPLSITASGPTTICTGQTVTLRAPAGFTTYRWHASGYPTADSLVVNAAGIYYCQMWDNSGIYHTNSVTVTVNPLPTASVTPNATQKFCYAAGGRDTLTAAASTGAAYQWRLNANNISGATTSVYYPQADGVYTVAVTNQCSTFISNAVTVYADSMPDINVPSPMYSVGALIGPYSQQPWLCSPVTFTATNVPGATYQWYRYYSNALVSTTTYNSFQVNDLDNYYVKVTSSCGTKTSNIFAVYPYVIGYVTASGPTSGCGVSSVTLTLQAQGPYQWYKDNVAIAGATSSSYTASISGWYYCTYYSNIFGCAIGAVQSQATTVTINTTPIPSISASGSTTLCASGSVALTASVSGATYQWRNNNVNITGATSQSYVVSLSGSYSCVITTTACGTIQSNSIAVWAGAPSGNISVSSNPICSGSSAAFSVSTSALNVTYQWRLNGVNIPGATNSPYSTNLAGSYDCVLTNSCGSSATAAVALVVRPLPTANITPGGTSYLCPSASIILSADTGTGYAYQWRKNNVNISGATQSAYSATLAASYNVNVTLSGCTVLSPPATITAVSSPAANIWSTTPAQFCGSGTVRLNTNTAQGYTYQWYENAAPIAGGTLSYYYASNPSTYSVRTTNLYGCTASGNLKVEQGVIADLNILHSGPVSLCPNTSIQLSSSVSGIAFQWYNNGVPITGATAGTLNVNSAGIYSLNMTNSLGCVGTASIGVIMSSLNNLTVTPTNVTCFGANNGRVTAPFDLVNYTYIWSTVPAQTTYYASALSPGPYTVTITDQYGCVATASATVTEPPVLSAAASVLANINCSGGNTGVATVSATGGTPAYTYSWSPAGGTNATASNLAAGTYSAKVTDSKGCSFTTNVTITQGSGSLTASSSVLTNVNCYGGNNGSAFVTASGTPPYTYQWMPSGGSLATANGLTAGTYTVNITDGNACNTSSTVTITQPSLLSAATSILNNVSCFGGSNGAASVNVTNGTAPYTYQWMPSGGNSSTANNLSTGTYTVNVTDANGCNASSTASITQPAALVASASVIVNVSCYGGNNGTAAVASSGGTIPYTYLWSSTGSTSATVTNLSAGNYTVTVTDLKGCNTSSVCIVTEPAVVIADINISANPSGTICAGTSVTFSPTPTNGGSSPTFQWKKNNVVVGTGSTYTSSSLANSDNVVCIMTSNVSCVTGNPATSNTITMSVTPLVAAGVSISANPSGTICPGASVTFTATPTNGGNSPTYQWKKNNVVVGAGNTYTTTTLANNDNIVCIMTSNAACVSGNPATSNTFTASVSSSVPAPPIPSGRNLICKNSTETYWVPPVNGTTFTWTVPAGASITNGQGTNNLNVHFSNSQTSGNVCVYATNACGNSTTVCKALTVVTAKPIAPSAITGPAIACPSGSATYTCPAVPNADLYNWTMPTNGTYGSVNNTNTMIVNFNSSFTGGTLKVAAGNCVGYGTNVSFAITSTPGTPGNISGSNSACTNQTVAYSIAAVAGATTYQWTAPAGSVIASGQGTTNVTVTFGTSSGTLSVRAGNTCGYGNAKTKSITVNCVARPELITLESEINSVFSLYPNPVSDEITIEAGENNLLLQIDIYCSDGRIVKSFLIGQKVLVNVSLTELSTGVYFFNCIGERNAEMVKVVKY